MPKTWWNRSISPQARNGGVWSGTNSVQLNGVQGVFLGAGGWCPLAWRLGFGVCARRPSSEHGATSRGHPRPASARFGSQAVGGVINAVLAPSPGDASAVRMDGHGRLQVSGSGVWR